MRLTGIDSILGANHFLETRFIPEWEQRFTVVPRQSRNAHRPLGREQHLEEILSVRVARRVTRGSRRQLGWKSPGSTAGGSLRGTSRSGGRDRTAVRWKSLVALPRPLSAPAFLSRTGAAILRKTGHFYFALTANVSDREICFGADQICLDRNSWWQKLKPQDKEKRHRETTKRPKRLATMAFRNGKAKLAVAAPHLSGGRYCGGAPGDAIVASCVRDWPRGLPGAWRIQMSSGEAHRDGRHAVCP